MSSCNVTCVDFNVSTDDTSNWPQGAPDPDISGIGVLFGFLATAYLTLAIFGTAYFNGYVSEEFLNSVDKGILSRKLRSKPAKTWESTFRTAILMFSDQQIVTGIAILISGYAQLRCGISAYHWQMIVYLAWFSSLTHLTTLTVLRQYFRDSLGPRLWRTFLMLVMVTMLGIALIPTGDGFWLGGDFNSDGEVSGLGISALCYFKRLVARSPEPRFAVDTINTPSMLISLMVLFSGYMTRLIRLSKQATTFTKMRIRTKPGKILKDSINDSIQRAEGAQASIYWRLKHLVLETIYVLLRAAFDIYESTLWEVRISLKSDRLQCSPTTLLSLPMEQILWLAFALAWGTTHIFLARTFTEQIGGDFDTSEENTWGFGQVYPVVLLALPILSMGESYYEKKRAIPNESENDTQSAQIDAAHETSRHTRTRLVLVGQWPARMTPALVTPPIALELNDVIHRTGTDIENEEETARIARFQLHSRDGTQAASEIAGTSQPLDTFSAENVISIANSRLDLSRDYYIFEWFWILIGTMVLMTSAVLIYGVLDLIDPRNVLVTWEFALISVVVGLVTLTTYAGMFVLLMEYHEKIEKAGTKYAHLRPGTQRTCLRVYTYVYAFGVISGVIVSRRFI